MIDGTVVYNNVFETSEVGSFYTTTGEPMLPNGVDESEVKPRPIPLHGR